MGNNGFDAGVKPTNGAAGDVIIAAVDVHGTRARARASSVNDDGQIPGLPPLRAHVRVHRNEQTPNMTRVRVRSSDSHTTLYVVQ